MFSLLLKGSFFFIIIIVVLKHGKNQVELKVQSHGIVRLQNRTICVNSCGCKTSLKLYLRFVGVFCVVTCIHGRSEAGCN